MEYLRREDIRLGGACVDRGRFAESTRGWPRPWRCCLFHGKYSLISIGRHGKSRLLSLESGGSTSFWIGCGVCSSGLLHVLTTMGHRRAPKAESKCQGSASLWRPKSEPLEAFFSM